MSFDNSKICKEGVSRTYKDCDRYTSCSPISTNGDALQTQSCKRESNTARMHASVPRGDHRHLSDEPLLFQLGFKMTPPRLSGFSWSVAVISLSGVTFARKAMRTDSGQQRRLPRISPVPWTVRMSVSGTTRNKSPTKQRPALQNRSHNPYGV